MTKMTYPALNTAVGKIIVETKLNVIDELTNYLDTKIDLDDDIKHAMCEFKEKITAAEKPIEKKKRKLSLFNLYVKDKLPQIKAAHPDIKDGKLMISMASEAWKKEPLALYIKEHSEQVKKEGEIDPTELYNKLKNMYDAIDDDVKKAKKNGKKKVNN
jgi:hypothetical protein